MRAAAIPNWLIGKAESEARRTIAFWLSVVAAVLLTPAYLLGLIDLFLAVVSVVALFGIFTAETPVEVEHPMAAPEDFPPEFKSWLSDYIAVSFPREEGRP